MSSLKIEQCHAMLRYLGVENFKFKIRCYDDDRRHVFTFNSDDTIDYAIYLDKYSCSSIKEIKNIGMKALTHSLSCATWTIILDTLYHSLKQKSTDKARQQAAQNYLNRQLCIGGLAFLIKNK